jgi:hypothetical protein
MPDYIWHVPGSAAPHRPQPGAVSKESAIELDDDPEPDTANTESCFSTRTLAHFGQSAGESWRGTIFSNSFPQS